MPTNSTPPARGAGKQHLLVKSLTPRSGEAFEVGTITVFLGPNNSGNTEVLYDIARLAAKFDPAAADRESGDEPQTKVLNDLTFVPKLTVERLTSGLARLGDAAAEETVVQGVGPDLKTPYRRVMGSDIKNILYRPVITARSVWMTSLGELMPLRVLYLDADQRSQAVAPTAACSPTQAPENLLQQLHYADPQVHADLDEAFTAAFAGRHLRLDTTQHVQLSLRVAAEFPPPADDPIQAVRQYEALPRLDEEGDGCQSYAAVLLCMLLAQGRIMLLDGPAAYLHPDQARLLGTWIADNAARLGCQVFLTTRDPALLSGLFAGQADVTLVTLARRDDTTWLRPIPAPAGQALVRFPLFASQQALDCLFRSSVVVVPEDDDRVIYQTIAHRLLNASHVGFLHAHGSRNMAFVAQVLRQARIPTSLVVELDVFQDEAVFSGLVKAVTGAAPPQPWLATRERLASHIEGWFDEKNLSASASEVESFLDQLKNGDMSTEAASAAGVAAADRLSQWELLKREKLDALPQELRIWVEELIDNLKQKGIFVSTRGRLQNWWDLDVSPDDTTAWFGKAVQTLDRGECPADLRAFVAELAAQAPTLSVPRAARRGHGA